MMTPKQLETQTFATKHAGEIVIVHTTTQECYNMRIAGYVKNSELIAVDTENSMPRNKPYFDEGTYIWLVKDPCYGWLVKLDQIELKNNKPLTPTNPYPHICKKCKSPARKCGGVILCSNLKCKSKRNLNTYLSKFPKQPIYSLGSRENPIVVRCPKCDKVATQMYGVHAPEHSKGAALCSTHDLYSFEFVPGKWYEQDDHNKRLVIEYVGRTKKEHDYRWWANEFHPDDY